MSSDNFDDIVTSDSAVWVVNFYDSAAPETEKWASTWTSLKSEIQEVKFASVDVESKKGLKLAKDCLLYTSPSPRDATLSRMPSSA